MIKSWIYQNLPFIEAGDNSVDKQLIVRPDNYVFTGALIMQ